jgi:hypothetical protein
MKKTFLSMTIIVLLLLCSSGIQAQDATKDLDQLKLMQKYLVGTWQTTLNDTTYAATMTQDGNVFLETDYIIVDSKKSAYSYWSYSYKPERDNFYIFAANVSGGCLTLIGSFTAENKWCQETFEGFNRDKYRGKMEFVFNTSTSCTITQFNADGVKGFEYNITKVE